MFKFVGNRPLHDPLKPDDVSLIILLCSDNQILWNNTFEKYQHLVRHVSDWELYGYTYSSLDWVETSQANPTDLPFQFYEREPVEYVLGETIFVSIKDGLVVCICIVHRGVSPDRFGRSSLKMDAVTDCLNRIKEFKELLYTWEAKEVSLHIGESDFQDIKDQIRDLDIHIYNRY